MNVLFTLLCYALLVLLLVGLVKPSTGLFFIKDTTKTNRKRVFSIYGGGILVCLIILSFLPKTQDDREAKENKEAATKETKSHTAEKPVVETKTISLKEAESTLITNYKSRWNGVKLEKIDGFEQYETYYDTLNKVIQDIFALTSGNEKALSKLEAFRVKLIDSKKNTDATKNFLIYGQPSYYEELKYPCENALEQILNDPSSLKIADYKIKGKSKNGWVVYIRYRAKNAFGAYVLNAMTFEVQHDLPNKSFKVVNAY